MFAYASGDRGAVLCGCREGPYTRRVHAAKPYSDRTGRDSFNDTDSLFDERLLLTLSRERGLITLDVA